MSMAADSKSAGSVAVARVGWGVLALCGALGLAVFALRHPFGVMAGGAIAVAFVVLMSVRRDAWLLCVPAPAPVVDLAGGSGGVGRPMMTGGLFSRTGRKISVPSSESSVMAKAL